MTPAPGGRAAARRFLAAAMARRRRQVAAVLAWSLLEAVPAFLSGRLVALALDRGFLVRRPLEGLAWLALLAGAVVAGAWAAGRVFRRLAALVEPVRDDLAVLVVAGAVRRAVDLRAGATEGGVARLTQQVEISREALASVLMVVQGFGVNAVAAVAGLASLAPAALPLVALPLAASLCALAAVLLRIAAVQRVSILADERIADVTERLVGGLRDVVTCGAEDAAHGMARHPIEAQAAAARRLATLAAWRTAAVGAGGWLPVALILVSAGHLRTLGASTGVILGALAYVLQGVHPALQSLARDLGGNGAWLLTALTRIMEALPGGEGEGRPATARGQPPAVVGEALPTTAGRESPTTVRAAFAGTSGKEPSRADPGATLASNGHCGSPAPRAGSALRFQGVTFSYGAAADAVLRDLDLSLEAGEHLAVVGPSGTGKSTLALLVAGVLTPQRGEVSIDGEAAVDVLERNPAARVLLPQEAHVFSGTLEENLRYLAPGASASAVEATIDHLGARPLIDRLGGMRATVDPRALSEGERQLLALVRAHLVAAPLTVLDEATCHLDPPAEARVERAFAERGGTLVVIAHRMSSALRAQRILVLDGDAAVAGTHGVLLDASPLYRDLVGHWQADGTAVRRPRGSAAVAATSVDNVPATDDAGVPMEMPASSVRTMRVGPGSTGPGSGFP